MQVEWGNKNCSDGEQIMWLLIVILILIAIYLLLKLLTILDAKCVFILFLLTNFAQQIASIIYLNSGIYVSELGRSTYYVPESSPLFIFYVDIFLFFLCIFAKKKANKMLPQNLVATNSLSQLFCYGTLIITSIFALYTIADLQISGIPLFVPIITRYNYYEMYSTLPYASTVNNLLGLCMYLLGYTYVHLPKSGIRILCIFFVLFTTIIRLLMGYRMSGLINIPLDFLAVVMLLSNLKFKSVLDLIKPQKILKAFWCALIIVTLFIVSSVLNGNAKSIAQGIEILFNRAFGLGNHLWWAAEADQVAGNDFWGHNLFAEIWAILCGKNQFDTNIGMYHLMLKYGNSYIVGVDIAHGIRYAATFITTSVYNWGYLFAFIPIAFTAYITIWFLNSIEMALMRDRFFQLILLCKIWGTYYTYVVASGTMTEWLNPENYIYFILYFFFHYYGRNKRFTLGKK